MQSLLMPWQLPGWQIPWKQMLPAPYCGSFTHCVSVVHPPQVLGVAMAHSCPVGQSALEPWQSPGMQPPATQTVDAPYDGSTLHATSLLHGLHVRVGASQICPPAQSDDTRHWPVTHTLPIQRCCGPYAVTQAASLLQATHESVAVLQIWPPPQSVVDRHIPETHPPLTHR